MIEFSNQICTCAILYSQYVIGLSSDCNHFEFLTHLIDKQFALLLARFILTITLVDSIIFRHMRLSNHSKLTLRDFPIGWCLFYLAFLFDFLLLLLCFLNDFSFYLPNFFQINDILTISYNLFLLDTLLYHFTDLCPQEILIVGIGWVCNDGPVHLSDPISFTFLSYL